MTDLLHQSRSNSFNTVADQPAVLGGSVASELGLVANFRRNGPLIPSLNTDFSRDFRKAFNKRAEDGRRGEGAGYLLKYSYHDTKADSWGAPVSASKPAWDNLVTQGGNYTQIPSEEVRTLNMAIREGLMDNIPTNIHYISLGPGETSAFKAKDLLILTGLKATGHNIQGASVIDIHDRYTKDAGNIIYDNFYTDVQAYGGDLFTYSFSRLPIEQDATPLICVFGGTLQNMPQTADKTSDEELVKFYSTLTKGLPNAHLLMTVDTTPEDVDSVLAVSAYEYSLEIELFVLNFMARAKEEGIIRDKGYDILKHWKMSAPEWKDKSVNLYIQAKRDHVLETADGNYEIKAGDRVSVSRSRKGPVEDHADMLKKAGFGKVECYPQNSNKASATPSKFILHATP